MTLNKNAQMVGQVFIYILALVLITFTLIFGYNAIADMNERQNQVAIIQFRQELSNVVEIITPDYGSVKIRQFDITRDFQEVCIVKNFENLPEASSIPNKYRQVQDSVEKGISDNVFLIGENNKVEESFNIGEIALESGTMLCIPVVNGKINLKFEGKGNHALVSVNEI